MKKLLISGLGILCFLSNAFTQQYAKCYPDNSSLWTGSTSKVLSTYSLTNNEIVVGNPFQRRGWAKFNISGVPDNATINNVEINLYVYFASPSPATHELVLSSLYVDPVTATGNTLWNSIDDPPDYLEESTLGDAIGYKVKGNLTNMINDINSSLVKNWFAVGFYERNEDADACYINGHLSANTPPYLVINFSLPAPTGVSATDGTYCDKVRISWNAVPNADRYYIYKGTTSLGDASNLYFDYFGASTSPEDYRVYAAKSSIDNRFSSIYGSDSGYKKSIPQKPNFYAKDDTICYQGGDAISLGYNVSTVSGATSYTWNWPIEWSASSSSTSITISGFGASHSSGTISVTADNSCGSSTPAELHLYVGVIQRNPGVITGLKTVCNGSSHTYSIVSVSGATSYIWTLPSGWSGSSASNSIEATAGTSGGALKVYAKNNFCKSNISILDIVIASKPTVTTSKVSKLSSSSVTCGGNITSDGGAGVIASGVCWNTSPDPTTSNSKTTDGAAAGTFTSTINGLAENVTYYIRAYATNCSGTSYGLNVEYNSSNDVKFIQSSEILVYPNPVRDILQIESKNSAYNSISIINPRGVIIRTENMISSRLQLDFSKYEPGLYILEFVKPGGEIERVRVIKQ